MASGSGLGGAPGGAGGGVPRASGGFPTGPCLCLCVSRRCCPTSGAAVLGKGWDALYGRDEQGSLSRLGLRAVLGPELRREG